MKITYLQNGILGIVYPNRLELTLSMCRIEEFYESPFENIRGKSFSLEEFISTYSDIKGNINYFSYWDGFNVPVSEMNNFRECNKILTSRELEIFNILRKDTKYVIATEIGSDKTTFEHELAHARYSTNEEYRIFVDEIIFRIPKELRYRLNKCLLDINYCESVLDDEIHSYLLTSTEDELIKTFDSINPIEYESIKKELQKVKCLT
jgi:hypothetical protein